MLPPTRKTREETVRMAEASPPVRSNRIWHSLPPLSLPCKAIANVKVAAQLCTGVHSPDISVHCEKRVRIESIARQSTISPIFERSEIRDKRASEAL